MPRPAKNSVPATPPDILLDKVRIGSDVAVPLHAQLQQSLREIIAVDLKNGNLFWPETQLVSRFKLSRFTIRQALTGLSHSGLLKRTPAGSFVTKPDVSNGISTVGIFLRAYDNEISLATIHEIVLACSERSLKHRLYYAYEGMSVDASLEQVTSLPSDEAFILMEARAVSKALASRGYRALHLGITGGEASYIDTDPEAAVEIGLKHLIGLGHRRIVLLVNEPDYIANVASKITAFERIVAQTALSECQIVTCGTKQPESSFDAAYSRMPEVWSHVPTAIFAVSDPGAWACLKWLSERGVSVPKQISVLGFEDANSSKYTHPALTTIAHPLTDIARTAVNTLVLGESVQLLLPPHLIIRKSTAPPPH